MNDQELADGLVAMGIGRTDGLWADGTPQYMRNDSGDWYGAHAFVRDWRVAGAVMELVDSGHWKSGHRDGFAATMYISPHAPVCATGHSLPRAIIEAGYRAYREGNNE